MMPFEFDDEAVRLANDSEYGLAAEPLDARLAAAEQCASDRSWNSDGE